MTSPAEEARHSDRGAVAILVLVTTSVIAITSAVAIGSLIADSVDAARARTAADAAALASVVVGGDATVAAELAARHGATLVTWRREGEDVVVRVRIGEAEAVARATESP